MACLINGGENYKLNKNLFPSICSIYQGQEWCKIPKCIFFQKHYINST
jgi:hypothetical protein